MVSKEMLVRNEIKMKKKMRKSDEERICLNGDLVILLFRFFFGFFFCMASVLSFKNKVSINAYPERLLIIPVQ